MASIQTGIQLNDQFSSVMYNIIGAVSMATSQFQTLEQTMNTDVDVSDYESIQQSLARATSGIEEMTQSQEEFNQKVHQGVNKTDQLTRTIKTAIGAYLSIATVKNVIGISDELTLTNARLNLMNDGLQTTEELTRMVYGAAQDARGSFTEMTGVVARFGNNAKDAFSSSAEVVAFANLVQKQMTIAGASTTESANAMLQLSQALGSGVLRGDELRSIFEQAPNLIQNIADYLDVPIGQIRKMAQEGELTADVVKAAIFAASDEINAKFAEMPLTFAQIWQQFQNSALMAFQPVLQRINQLANSEQFQVFVNNAISALATLAEVVINIFDAVAQVGAFVSENWSVIEPIVMAAVTALGAYLAVSTAVNVMNGITAASEAAKAASQAMATGATFAETAAQYGLNAALYACPLTWIIGLFIALVAIIGAVTQAIANFTGAAASGLGIVAGGVNVVIQFFVNLGLTVANIALGIINAIGAVCSNIMTAFHNAICRVQEWWYNLLSTVLGVISGICEALNKLPFVEFDYSGIANAASDYASKAAEAAGNREEYKNIADEFSKGMETFKTFQGDWVGDAFKAGTSWGDGVAEGIGNFFGGGSGASSDVTSWESPDTSQFGNLGGELAKGLDGSGTGSSIGDIADKTGAIKDSLTVAQEDLKYLRDIAEQDAINRFTTAEIKLDYSGMTNNISNGMDLDGVVSAITDGVNEAIATSTEGVHS